MSVSDVLLHFFKCFGVERTYVIAFSGGLDSHVLLHACFKLQTEYPLTLKVMHVNHGLSQHANDWALHCEAICNRYAIPFELKKVNITIDDGNIEANARKARYAALHDVMSKDDILLTAHTKDDQAETLLLQLLRGAGPKGLAAMPKIKQFGQGFHARPLLDISREEMKAYALTHQLNWIEDESNDDVSFKRNLIRHQVLPLLRKTWPDVSTSLARSASHLAEMQAVLDDYLLTEYEDVKGSEKDTLSVMKLRKFSSAKKRLMLRTWFAVLNVPMPNAQKLTTIEQQMFNALPDKNPEVAWGDFVMRRYKDNLYVLRVNCVHDADKKYSWKLNETLTLPGIGKLHAQLTIEGERLSAEIKNVEIAFRNGGEVLRIHGQRSRSLKQVFQECCIPPWVRNKIPLVYLGETLIAVHGYFLHPDYAAKNDQKGYALVLESDEIY